MSDAPFTALETWFEGMCDGDWEHSHGVRIESLDNPGWSLEIDIAGMKLDLSAHQRVEREVSERNWVHMWVEGDVLRATCGPRNLGAAISLVLSVLKGQRSGR